MRARDEGKPYKLVPKRLGKLVTFCLFSGCCVFED